MNAFEKTTKVGAPGGVPSGKPYLSVASGRHGGRLYPIEPGSIRLLGRSAECDPRFPGIERVSRTHAEIGVDANSDVWLRDISTNGTTVGGRLVHHGRVTLQHGDWIVLGAETDALRAEWLSDDEVRGRIVPFVDELTGLWTRRHLASRLADLLDSTEDLGEPLCMIMIDLDHFGRFNKSHGQRHGDLVLREFSRCLMATVRDIHPIGDAGRHGGEEFVVLLPRCTKEQGAALAETIRARTEAIAIDRDGRPVSVTASLGGVTCRPEPGMSLDDLTHLANVPLLRAKDAGRNRVLWADDPTVGGG